MKNLIVVKGQQKVGDSQLAHQFRDAHIIDDAVRVPVKELKSEVKKAYEANTNIVLLTNHYHCGIDNFFKNIAEENDANFFILTSKI